MNLNPKFDSEIYNNYNSTIMAPSIDDLTGRQGTKAGDKFLISKEGAGELNQWNLTNVGYEQGSYLEAGDTATVLKGGPYVTDGDWTYVGIPTPWGVTSVRNNGDLFSGRAPEQESPSPRERR